MQTYVMIKTAELFTSQKPVKNIIIVISVMAALIIRLPLEKPFQKDLRLVQNVSIKNNLEVLLC